MESNALLKCQTAWVGEKKIQETWQIYQEA